MIPSRPVPVPSRRRLRLLAATLAAAFLLVGGQLANLQILSGERLAALSDRNRLRLRDNQPRPRPFLRKSPIARAREPSTRPRQRPDPS